MYNKYTPVKDVAKKIDIMEHINDDHQSELCSIVEWYLKKTPYQAKIIDIYEEGCLIEFKVDSQEVENLFIPFSIRGDLDEKVHYLAYESLVKLGKPLGSNKIQYFTILNKEMVTPHMLRLTIRSESPLPLNSPGYAWSFFLKKFPKLESEKSSSPTKFQNWLNYIVVSLLKYLSPKSRHKILISFSKGKRYYTLRKAIDSNTGLVDIYLHGTTEGGVWAESLEINDIIRSENDYVEKTEHLSSGKALLIGDETALPTILNLLENWKNPIPPTVISITKNIEDQEYLKDTLLPTDTIIRPIIGSKNIKEDIIQCLSKLGKFDTVWGALEQDDAKYIRQYLRSEYQLVGINNRIKGYWISK